MKIKSYLSKNNTSTHDGEDGKKYCDTFQNTKLDILIASSNSMADINNFSSTDRQKSKSCIGIDKLNIKDGNSSGSILKTEHVLQKKISSNKISENTKKMLVKVYEIDLVPLTLNSQEEKKKSNYLKSKEEKQNFYGVNQATTGILSHTLSLEDKKENKTKTHFSRSASVCSENKEYKASELLANMSSTNYANNKRNFSIIENIKRQGG